MFTNMALRAVQATDAKQELLPIQPGHVPATFADIRRAQAKLGFRPTTTLEVGIPGFIKWFKAYHGIPPSTQV